MGAAVLCLIETPLVIDLGLKFHFFRMRAVPHQNDNCQKDRHNGCGKSNSSLARMVSMLRLFLQFVWFHKSLFSVAVKAIALVCFFLFLCITTHQSYYSSKSSRLATIFFKFLSPNSKFLFQSVLRLAPWPWTLGLVLPFLIPGFSPCLRGVHQTRRGLRRFSSNSFRPTVSSYSSLFSVLLRGPGLGVVFAFPYPRFSPCLRVSVSPW